jgi:hypothetical protein
MDMLLEALPKSITVPLIIVCWGEYLGLRGTRQQRNRKKFIMRTLMIFTPHPI